MPAIVVIAAIVIWMISASNSKKKKPAAAASKRPTAAQTVSRPTAFPKAAFDEGSSYEDDSGCVGGSLEHTEHSGTSVYDDMGCVGGSLEHTEHEGGRVVDRSSDWQESRLYGKRAGTVNTADMRRAVILSEILKPPVSMRGKREDNA